MKVNDQLTIPDSELEYRVSRSSGPGGQNVNKVNTKVQLRWHVESSRSLSDYQRELLLKKLSLTKTGEVIVASGSTRSQEANREDCEERFRRLLVAALKIPKRRKKTKIPKSIKRAIGESKKHRGRLKKDRKKPDY